MKHFLPSAAILSLFFMIGFAPQAFATVPPTLQLSATGSGDGVRIAVTGDPSASVLLSFTEIGSGPQIVSLGSTDASGSFVSTVSSVTYGLTSGTPVTAIIGGTSGPKSPTIAWPTVTSASSLALSQNAVVLTVGSSASITATNSGTGALYVSNNSNSSIANVSINGTQVSFSGNVAGVTTVTLCTVGTATNCPSVYVTVEQAGSSLLSFSQSTATVVSGQNLPITISGGNGTYQIAYNANASVIQASVSGSVLTLTTGASSGSSSITVCSSDGSTCGVVIATAGSASSVALSFSSSAPTVSVNESTTVNLYGPSGVSFYVSSNSTPSVVQANLSGATLMLTGIAPGTSSVSVCASTGTCASLTVTVQNAATGGNITLGQNTLSILSGGNQAITVTGGEQPYFISGGTSSVSQETLSGNTLTVYGVAGGTSSVNVCSAGGGCASLVVTVNGSSAPAAFSMSQNSLSLDVGQGATVTLSGTGSYYLSANTSPSIASVAVSGSSAVVAGLSSGSTDATICQSGSSCGTLSVTVNRPASTIVTQTLASGSPAYTFTTYLARGSEGAAVWALQKLLAAQGELSAAPNGYFGPQTKAAVIAFQSGHRIESLGVVGPATRAALNQIERAEASSSASSSNAGISSLTLSQLQAEAQSLEAQLTEVLSRISQLTGQ